MNAKQLISNQFAINHCLHLLEAFNTQSVQRCASLYDDSAMLRSTERQFIIGRFDIQEFWSRLIAKNACCARLHDIEMINEEHDYFVVHVQWQMDNNAHFLFKETWCKTDSGFSIIEQRVNQIRSDRTSHCGQRAALHSSDLQASQRIAAIINRYPIY